MDGGDVGGGDGVCRHKRLGWNPVPHDPVVVVVVVVVVDYGSTLQWGPFDLPFPTSHGVPSILGLGTHPESTCNL